MKDFYPKGTGDSRYLKSSIPATTSHEDLVTMLRNGTFPIDLNGINSAGVAQQGTPLSKATLLKDATAALFGLGTDAVPDDVLAMLSKAALYKTVVPDIQLGALNEGDVFTLNENGQPVEFYVAKKDYEPSYNSNRVLVVRKDPVQKGQWNSSGKNAYNNSIIDTWFNQTYLKMLDGSVQSAIGTTNIPYTPMGGTTTVKRVSKSVFALSLTELGRSDSNAKTEGTHLPIASSLIGIDQWTRTPNFNTSGVFAVTSSGLASNQNVTSSYYYRPAFTLPSTFNTGESTTGLYDVSNNLLLKLPGVQIAAGSYVGTGKYGSSNPNSLTLGFKPKIIVMCGNNTAPGSSQFGQEFKWIDGADLTTDYTALYLSGAAGSGYETYMSLSSANVLKWYGNSLNYQFNTSGWTYHYWYIG